jgi:hypothetical protein
MKRTLFGELLWWAVPVTVVWVFGSIVVPAWTVVGWLFR